MVTFMVRNRNIRNVLYTCPSFDGTVTFLFATFSNMHTLACFLDGRVCGSQRSIIGTYPAFWAVTFTVCSRNVLTCPS